MEEKVVYLYLSLTEEIYLGKLYIQNNRGKEVYSIELSDDYLKSKYSKYKIDPEISNYIGRQFQSSDKPIFGFLSDSCPDRWGRILMKRKEAEIAKLENRKPKQLTEADYLLGVYDESRMGALRFKLDKDGDYLTSSNEETVPPWIYLRTLEDYALQIDNEEAVDDKWIKNLLIPGSSLGGARPKANVYAPNGDLWIAKFPSKKDSLQPSCQIFHHLSMMSKGKPISPSMPARRINPKCYRTIFGTHLLIKADSVLGINDFIIATYNDIGRRCLIGNMKFITIAVLQFLRRIFTQQMEVGPIMSQFFLHRNNRIEKNSIVWTNRGIVTNHHR